MTKKKRKEFDSLINAQALCHLNQMHEILFATILRQRISFQVEKQFYNAKSILLNVI